MRKTWGIALVGVGIFLLVLGLMSASYAYPKLAVAPLNQDSSTVSDGPNATIFDIASASEVTTDLVSIQRVGGDVKAGKAAGEKYGKPVAVWDTLVYTYKKGAKVDDKHPPLSANHDRVAFDGNTGRAITCCGTYTSSSASLDNGEEKRVTTPPVQGLYYKFPFNAQKHRYQFWDGSLKQATWADYKGTDSIQDLTVYRYEQVIAPTKVTEITAPASFFDISKPGDVTVDEIYANTRTLWVEPETGVIIRGQEQQHVVAQYQGKEVSTLTDVTIGYNPKTITDNVNTYGPKASQLHLVRVWVPLLGTVLGGLLLLAGLVLLVISWTRARRQAPA